MTTSAAACKYDMKSHISASGALQRLSAFQLSALYHELLTQQMLYVFAFAVQRMGVLRQHVRLCGVRLQEHKLQCSVGR